jgi:hypothetical protein
VRINTVALPTFYLTSTDGDFYGDFCFSGERPPSLFGENLETVGAKRILGSKPSIALPTLLF